MIRTTFCRHSFAAGEILAAATLGEGVGVSKEVHQGNAAPEACCRSRGAVCGAGSWKDAFWGSLQRHPTWRAPGLGWRWKRRFWGDAVWGLPSLRGICPTPQGPETVLSSPREAITINCGRHWEWWITDMLPAGWTSCLKSPRPCCPALPPPSLPPPTLPD